jgi:uncharacterized membrane protein
MLKLDDYELIFYTIGLIGALLFASPTLTLLVHLPSGERFSELWVLGLEHMGRDYPFNVKANVSYLVYVGVSNHVGSLAYYNVSVKFGNQTETSFNATTSPLPSLYEYHIFLQDSKSWETPLTFSFSNASLLGNQFSIGLFAINNVTSNVDELTTWDPENKGYYYQLLIELWIRDVESSMFKNNNNQSVGIWLNVTEN